MTKDGDRVAALEARVDELSRYILQVEVRLERLQMELEELSRYSAGIQESLSILGVTSGYAPPKENTANEKEFDPSVG